MYSVYIYKSNVINDLKNEKFHYMGWDKKKIGGNSKGI